MKQAVIFDIDGVLVDSYEAHFLSWQQLALNHGRTCTQADFEAGFGQTSRKVIQSQWSDFGLTESLIKQLDEEKEELYRQLVKNHFPEMPGASKLINDLHQNQWLLALGSSGPKENVDLAIEKLKISDLLGAAVSGQDVKNGKPDPEVFLKAAQRLALPPSQCLVIEDATHGIEAAHAAGMKCVGMISRGRSREELAEADLLITSLTEINSERCHEVLTTDL